MPRYPDAKGFDHAAAEEQTLQWWDQHDVFAQSLAQREGAPHFVFYEGPPTANGKPGIHHVMARTIKDLFCRYRTMKGFRVDRKGGWDTHGLPVEIEVEKALGLEGRHEIGPDGKISIEAYNAACRESVLRYKDLWDDLTRRMGYWVDLSDPYITFENDYIESVWALLKAIAERQTADGESFLYRGHKIQWYSPGSGTVLSSHEVSLGYEEVQDPSVYVRFPVEGEPDTSFLAWTTTPWTLVSNTALAVGEGIDYVKVRAERAEAGKNGSGEEFLYLAEALLGTLGGEHEVVERITGRDLVGKTYRPVFDTFADHPEADRAWRVVPAHFVSTEDGTGIVHMAPAFGADDFVVGQREDLPLFNPVTPDGRFTDAMPLVEGQWFKDADKALARDLRERGLLYRHETYLHNYPHDWRKGTPLMSYPVESWFIRTTAIKDRLVELNQTINWQPEGIGTGRFGQWLEGNVDWALSRMRYWGTPLPVWVSDRDPDDYVVIGSLGELREKAVLRDSVVDLHRPFVDEITWPAPGGGTYRRVPDLIDVWFDSGAMPFAQWHYPFENHETFARNFPADFIAEGVDQTRGWFYTLHAIAALVEDSVAYKNVVVNGLVLDEKGEKMSKTKGNTVDPFATIDRHGADPVRWTLMSASAPWESLRYSDRAVEETKRKFFSTVTNTYSFFATYANLDGFAYGGDPTPLAERTELDRWILSRLGTTVGAVDAAFGAYHPTQAARAMETFADDLSNWYLRRSRRRFWKGSSDPHSMDVDKRAAYETTYECLTTLAKLMAPLAPFYAEWLWGALRSDDAPASVHLADFPAVDEAAVDAALEDRMALARTVASITLALRNEAGINVRQPLGALSVVTGTAGVDEATLRSVEGIVLDEVNVKRIDATRSDSGLVAKSARPNFKALGRRLGPLMKAANAAIRALGADAISRYETEGSLTLDLEGPSGTREAVAFRPGDIDIASEGIEGHLVGQEGPVTVALDTTITDALRDEGVMREFVNRVQNLRKTAAFAVADRIFVTFRAPDALADAIRAHADTIRNETLAERLSASDVPSGDAVETFEIGGEPVEIGVRRVGAEETAAAERR
ncbi:MAG: isoleucine--tRNA ligase [Bacteroidota bacterium]